MKPCAVSWLIDARAPRRQKRAAMWKAPAESFGARRARAARELPACVPPFEKVVLTPRTVNELTDILKPRAKDDEERYRPGEVLGGPTKPRPSPRRRGATF